MGTETVEDTREWTAQAHSQPCPLGVLTVADGPSTSTFVVVIHLSHRSPNRWQPLRSAPVSHSSPPNQVHRRRARTNAKKANQARRIPSHPIHRALILAHVTAGPRAQQPRSAADRTSGTPKHKHKHKHPRVPHTSQSSQRFSVLGPATSPKNPPLWLLSCSSPASPSPRPPAPRNPPFSPLPFRTRSSPSAESPPYGSIAPMSRPAPRSAASSSSSSSKGSSIRAASRCIFIPNRASSMSARPGPVDGAGDGAGTLAVVETGSPL